MLGFNGVWIDGTEKRDVEVHYFLADDMIELKEVVSANNGRDRKGYMKKQKVPRVRACMVMVMMVSNGS